MSGTDYSRLLIHVTEAHFGPIVAEIVALLLKRGSLPFPQLLLLSGFPPSQVHSALLILSLHSLLFHSESEVNGRLTELYEINEDNLYSRLRGSLYVSLAEETLGLNDAVGLLWKEGMLNAEDIVAHVGENLWRDSEDKAAAIEANQMIEGSKAKGKGKGKEKETGIFASEKDAKKEAMQIVRRGVRDGFLSIITSGSQVSPRSLEIKWEGELRLQIKGVPTGKDMKELKEALRRKKQEWAQEERDRAAGKASSSSDSAPKKKRKLEGDDFLPTLPRGACFKINTERFNIRWRNQLILDHAKNVFRNPAIDNVLSTILSVVESDVDSLTEIVSRPFTTHEILPHLIPLTPYFATSSTLKPPLRNPDALNEILLILARADDNSVDTSKAFLTSIGGGGKWAVNFGPLGEGMRRALVEQTVEEMAGKKALTAWRVLEKKGMLEEKHLARLAFLPIKEAREALSKLSSLSLIETQEVPRSADRAPSRTLYLFYTDVPKLTQSLLLHLYKAMANVHAQKRYQLELKRGLVEKRERGRGAGLTRADLEGLEKLETVLEALEVANQRIDRDVFLLKTAEEEGL